jgi:hypothetical protein
MEMQNFVSSAPVPPTTAPAGPMVARVGFPSGAWHGGTLSAVQGGGLQLANLPRVLPEMIVLLRAGYGDVLLGLAVWGAVLALFRRPLLFFGPAVYVVLAVLLYACWSKPDGRYLSGVYIVLPMLIVEGAFGTLDVVRRLAAERGETTARVFAIACAALLGIGMVLFRSGPARGALPILQVLVPGVAAAALVAAALRPAVAIDAVAAPVLALALTVMGCSRMAQGLDSRATFQHDEMARARATFARAVEPRAVVITTEDVGRPGENIDYYSGVAHALYLTDLERWRMTIPEAAELLARGGFRPYLLLPAIQPGLVRLFADLRLRGFAVDTVADIPAQKAMDYFVAAAFYPGGIRMWLFRLRWGGDAP